MFKLSAEHRKCSAVGCTEQHSRLYLLPATEDRGDEWIKFIFDWNILSTARKSCGHLPFTNSFPTTATTKKDSLWIWSCRKGLRTLSTRLQSNMWLIYQKKYLFRSRTPVKRGSMCKSPQQADMQIRCHSCCRAESQWCLDNLACQDTWNYFWILVTHYSCLGDD